MKVRSKKFIAAVLVALGVALLALSAAEFEMTPRPVWSPTALFHADDLVDHLVGHTVTIYDESGRVISKMSRAVYSGDELITGDGKHYRVTKVDDQKATAKLLGMDKDYLAWVDYFANMTAVPVTSAENQRPVAVYHTHTAESYVPTDGAESQPFQGGILNVGKVFADALEERGVKVLYSDNKHDPHDNNAYMRSRRTATELMQQNPIAMFDVHRDGIPDPDFYYDTIGNQEVTQIRIVLGNQNPKKDANEDFAKRLMAYANQKHPDIVKEIFSGKGNYNQDLMSTNILLEAGTHTNRREMAEEGIVLLADAVPVVLGLEGGAGPGPETGAGAGRAGWTTVAWILGAVVVAGIAFLWISSGSLKGAADRISSFGREMTGIRGPAKKPGGKSKDEDQGE
ncbi:stage II sporulation protein P, partial [Desulfofalx alkaliphila]|uniref:stage II sporulation protein P n=1 Tax=Desulfofalx alkaliphila TaxID=105483 RepID=UPI0004E27CFE